MAWFIVYLSKFLMYLRRMCILLLFCGVFYKYKLSTLNESIFQVVYILTDNLSTVIINYLNKGIEIIVSICEYFYSFFQFY